MDKPFVVVGSVIAALVVGYGVGSAANHPVQVIVNLPPGGSSLASPAASSYATPRTSLTSSVPKASDATDWALLTSYEHQPEMVGLPDSIKALDGKKVSMRGFLAPLYEFDDIHEFLLVPNHMSCCFGMPPGLNGTVYVKISSARGLPNTNEPIEVRGTFRATERKEQGYVLSIYEIVDSTARIIGY